MLSIHRQPLFVRFQCVGPQIAQTMLTAVLAMVVVLSGLEQNTAVATEPLFTVPNLSANTDEIFLISTREVGTSVDSQRLQQGLRCHRFVGNSSGQTMWQKTDWRNLLVDPIADRTTVFYVHGNRVAPGKDLLDGLEVYRSLKLHGKTNGPVRFIIWSWPSTPIPRPFKDFRLKATLTHPVAWQFAWLLQQFPAKTKLSLVGYSYGARIVSGALHLLQGGQLGKLKMNTPSNEEPSQYRAALIAAAYDESWIEPGNYYGRAIQQIERMIISSNKQDPAMRFYHLSNGRGRIHALGRQGITHLSSLGASADRIRHVDFSEHVGRSHSLMDYLAADIKMQIIWQQLFMPVKKRGTFNKFDVATRHQ
ncbi:MAG: hypothetical protein CMJ72_08815 [Planctomycetaceae bacterium]|nr:hypothetical protein [Planctomycetaceae bacterium]